MAEEEVYFGPILDPLRVNLTDKHKYVMQFLPKFREHTFYSKDWIDVPKHIHVFIIPHVKFKQSDWSIDRVTILNVTQQRLTAVKVVVEMGHSV